MTTLSETTMRQSAILMALNQVESILQPVHTGQGKNDVINILPGNIERLAINSDLISNNFCSVRVISKEFQPGKPRQVVNIQGDAFGISFEPAAVCTVKKGLEKRFKEVETFTRKAEKQRPGQVPEKPVNTAKSDENGEKLLINSAEMMKKDSETVTNDSEECYICLHVSPIREPRPWFTSRQINLSPTLTTLEEFLSESWKDFARV